MTTFEWIVFVAMVIAALLSVASTLKVRRIFTALEGILDEGPNWGTGSFFGRSQIAGHYHGRKLKMVIRAGGEDTPPQLNIQLSCSIAPEFTADRQTKTRRVFGLDVTMLAVPDSRGFLLQRKGWLPRRLLGIDLGGGTGLPLVTLNDPTFGESFSLSASELARDAVAAWIGTPQARQQVESLFSTPRLALLTPAVSRDGEVFLTAVIRDFERSDLEPTNVRIVLERLEATAKSLEGQRPTPTEPGAAADPFSRN